MEPAFQVLLVSWSFPFPSHEHQSSAGERFHIMCNTYMYIHNAFFFSQSHHRCHKGTESYTLLQSLTDVIKDVNDLIENPTLDGIPLKIILVSDYKVHVHAYTCTLQYIGTHNA